MKGGFDPCAGDPCQGDGMPACRDAVQRCYTGLCQCGQPERHALEAAVTVYRYHHPDSTQAQAETIVSHWVAGPVRH
jgi:hypothetical protein